MTAAAPAAAVGVSTDETMHECLPVGRDYKDTWATAHKVPGEVRERFGTLRWSANHIRWDIRAGYRVQLCLGSTDAAAGTQFTDAGRTILGPDAGSTRFPDLTDVGYGAVKVPTTALPATGAPTLTWGLALAGAATTTCGAWLLRRRTGPDSQPHHRPLPLY